MGNTGGTGVARTYTNADRQAIELDEVVRARRLMATHPGLSITSPRENGTDQFIAILASPDAPDVTSTVHHWDLRKMCDNIEKILGKPVP